ncbi:MAG UNVERIFIED_CONTAM: 50S ribosomal protein L18 [Rickettsiaceae bacterium]|jgi:large subunit ribosomal protein L18
MRTAKRKFEIRKNRVRSKIARLSDRIRLSVFKSGRHIYAQVIDDTKSQVIAAASTLEKDLRQDKKSNCNREIAAKVGALVAERAAKKGVKEVVFDKAGYKYHGVIKALADSAREKLQF